MQIIEHSVIGTRSAVLRLKCRGAGLQFVVFPMIHVASPQFYAAVAERLRRCDLLVVEGVADRSPLTWALTATYRVIPAHKRSGLVVDDIAYRSLGVPVVHADVTSGEFAEGWRAMPMRHRLAFWCLLPFVVVAQLAGGTRRLLSPEVELNDLPRPREEAMADSAFGEHFDRAVVGDRDERLLSVLSELVRTRSAERIDVAVVYGAGHVPGIVRGLYERHRYRPQAAEWLTVLST
jgi:hypothetical protein